MVEPILNQSIETAVQGITQFNLNLMDYSVGSKELQAIAGAVIIMALVVLFLKDTVFKKR